MIDREWPKKMSATAYAKRWHVDVTHKTIINRIKAGNLPGGKEPGGQWYVWVEADLSPAFDYEPPAQYDASTRNKLSPAAQAAVERITRRA